MKQLIILLIIISFNIQAYAQLDARTEYVPLQFNNRAPQVNWNAPKPLEIARIPVSPRNVTYSFSVASFVDLKENTYNTQEIESTITIKKEMIEVILGQNHFTNRIISEFWYQDTIKTYKTVDADNTVITYRQFGSNGKHFEIEIPDMVVVLMRE